MKFEIYCDENNPDLFATKKPAYADYMMIGGLWIPSALRQEIKTKIHEVRAIYQTWGEIKWTKISSSKIEFYTALIDLFFSYGLDVRFRCIAIDANQFDSKWHNNDQELGFYKFYYQLLHHWILDFNEYRIFCDLKTNRNLTRLKKLKECLDKSNITSNIHSIQALPSKEVALIQFADLLLGIASARLNRTIKASGAKEKIIERLESHLDVKKLTHTSISEQKFNIFKINLQGGW